MIYKTSSTEEKKGRKEKGTRKEGKTEGEKWRKNNNSWEATCLCGPGSKPDRSAAESGNGHSHWST